MAPRSAAGIASEVTPLRALRDNQGVSHVLKGTFVAQSEIVRISVQLIDTGTGEAVWAERFEGNLSDLFSLEDKLANRIAAVLSVTIDPDESRRIYLRHTSNREAMKLLRHATVAINPPNERGRIETARGLHQRIIDIDPSFAGGYAGMSQVHSYMVLFEHSSRPEEDLKSAIEYARKAIELDDGFGMGHSMLGLAHSLAGQTDLALAQARRAVALEPGDPLSYQWLSGVLNLSDRPDEAVTAILEALRLDPIEPGTPYLNILGMAYFNGEQYELAIEAFERNRQKGGPDAPNIEAYRAATYAALGRETEAREVIAELNVRPGEISPENWIRRWTPSRKISEKAIGALHRLGMKDRTGTSTGKSPSTGAAGTTQ
jgi:tetratricopeptide (TPR) repeat protein